MGYTPAAQGGTSTTTSGSSLSGGSGSGTFLVPTSLGTPGQPARPRPERGDSDFANLAHPDPGVAPTFEDSGQLAAKLYAMPQLDLANLQTQLKLAGYGNVLSSGIVDQNTLDAYQQLLTDTARYAATGGTAYTPDTLLAAKVAANNAAGVTKSDGPQTNTSSQVDFSDPLTARRLVTDSLKSKLGRNPSAGEVSAFTAALHSYEQQNPSNTTTTVTPGLAGSSSSSVSSQGASPADYADAYAMSNQGRANEAGALNESRFVDVLHSLMGG